MRRDEPLDPQRFYLDRPVDLSQVLQRVMDEVRQRLRADRCTLFLMDHARQELVSRLAVLPEVSEIRVRVGEGVAGLVARDGRVRRASVGQGDQEILRRVDAQTGYRTRSTAAAPVRSQAGELLGVLQLLNQQDGAFSLRDAEQLQLLADQVGVLLESTSLGPLLRPGQSRPLVFRYNRVIGESTAMQAAYERTARAAATDVTVLLRGASGSGKGLLARAIHDNSPRRDGPFVTVDCAALPESLIENELFGHEKGAFTGADSAADGKVAEAQGGTLFLDEVGELPLAVQGKLLRLVQERSYLRVGGSRARSVDLRFLCATNRDLAAEVAAGRFRQDLFFRVRVVEILLPSLAERGPEDLDRLIDHFLYHFGRRYSRAGLQLTPEARARLHAHPWPGNVRELENCLEAAVVLSPGPRIGAEALLPTPPPPLPAPPGAEGEGPRFVAGIAPLAEVERAYLDFVLHWSNGNKAQAARVLGIGRNTLLRKLNGS